MSASTHGHQKPQLVEILSWLPGLAAAITIIVAQVLGRSGISGFPILTGITGLCTIAAIALVASGAAEGKRTQWRVTPRDWLVLGSYVLVAGAILKWTLHGSTFSPVTFSVDLGHHGAVVEWMRVHEIIPTEFVPELAGQSGYPAGSYTLTALISWVTGRSPLQAMWLFGVAMVLATWFIAGSIVEAMVGPRARPFFLVPIPLALAAWQFTIGMVSDSFFFAQLAGIWIAMSAVAAIVWWSIRGVKPPAIAAVAFLATAACLFTYPQSAMIPVLAFFLEIFRTRWVKRPIVPVLAACSLIALYAMGRTIGLSTSAFVGLGDGSRTLLSAKSVGGWLIISLFFVGLLEVLRIIRHPGSRAVLGAALGPTLLAGGLAAMRLPIFGGYPVTDYRIGKNIYAVIPIAVIITSVAIVQGIVSLTDVVRVGFVRTERQPRGFRIASAVVCAGIAAGSIFSSDQRSALRYPIITRGEYAAMGWAVAHAEPSEVGTAFPGLAGYQLWWLKSGRPADEVHASMRTGWRLARWDNWPTDGTEKYLVTSGYLARTFRNIPGTTVRFRAGNAVVLERPGTLFTEGEQP